MSVAAIEARVGRALGVSVLAACLAVASPATAWALPEPLPVTTSVGVQLPKGVEPLQVAGPTLVAPDTALNAERWRQSKTTALVLGILAPGAGQAYAGRWDRAGGTVLWWGGGLAIYLLGVLAMFTGGGTGWTVGQFVGLAGLATSGVFQVLGAVDAMALVDQATHAQP
jgi:hypothetical protein